MKTFLALWAAITAAGLVILSFLWTHPEYPHWWNHFYLGAGAVILAPGWAWFNAHLDSR